MEKWWVATPSIEPSDDQAFFLQLEQFYCDESGKIKMSPLQMYQMSKVLTHIKELTFKIGANSAQPAK